MLLTREELDASARVHPQMAEALSRIPRSGTPNYNTPDGSRLVMKAFEEAILARIGPSPAGITELYHQIPMRDGFSSSLKIHKPAAGNPGPLVVLCFGGGYVSGSLEQLTDVARALVQLAGATVVNISYRLGPEHKFPQAPHDGIDSVRWIAENATSGHLAADPSKGFIIGGVSAGGNMSACLTRYFQQHSLSHPVTGQWLAIPSIMDSEACPAEYRHLYIARDQNADTPILNKETLAGMKAMVQWDATSELRAPIHSKSPLSGQPRTYFQIDGMDPLRDDALIYDELLRKAGVETKVDFYPGCTHGHWWMTIGYEVGDNAAIDTIVGIAWLLDVVIARDAAAKALVLPSH